MSLGYADENSGLHLADAAQQIFISHTRIDQDNYGPDLEKRKGKRNKFH